MNAAYSVMVQRIDGVVQAYFHTSDWRQAEAYRKLCYGMRTTCYAWVRQNGAE